MPDGAPQTKIGEEYPSPKSNAVESVTFSFTSVVARKKEERTLNQKKIEEAHNLAKGGQIPSKKGQDYLVRRSQPKTTRTSI